MVELPNGHFESADEYLCDECPQCRKYRHFYWNVVKHKGICHSCDLRVYSLEDFRKLFALTEFDLADGPAFDPKGDPFTLQRDPLFWTNAWDVPKARMVLIGRRITEEVARQVPIGCVHGDKLLISVDSIESNLPRGIWYRGVKGWPSKWISLPNTQASCYAFGLSFIPPERKTVLIVEGIYDVLSTGLLGHAIAILGTKMQWQWPYYLRKRGWKVVIWLDPDRAGLAASPKLLRFLQTAGISAMDLTPQAQCEPGDLYPEHPDIVRLREQLCAAV